VSPAAGSTLSSRGGGSTGGAAAHRREVKDLAVSKDVSLLLSASADCTLAVWNIDTDRQITSMTGHRDEVTAQLPLRKQGVKIEDMLMFCDNYFTVIACLQA